MGNRIATCHSQSLQRGVPGRGVVIRTMGGGGGGGGRGGEGGEANPGWGAWPIVCISRLF